MEGSGGPFRARAMIIPGPPWQMICPDCRCEWWVTLEGHLLGTALRFLMQTRHITHPHQMDMSALERLHTVLY